MSPLLLLDRHVRLLLAQVTVVHGRGRTASLLEHVQGGVSAQGILQRFKQRVLLALPLLEYLNLVSEAAFAAVDPSLVLAFESPRRASCAWCLSITL